MRDLDLGDLRGRRDQKIHEAPDQRLAVGVVDDALVERAADALGHAAADLSLHDGRVHHRAAVVLDHVAQELQISGRGIDLHDRGVAAAGERGMRRRVVAARLEAGLLAFDQHRSAASDDSLPYA